MFEVSWLAPQRCVERSSDALIDELGALSVSVEDADAGSASEQALFGEPGALPDGLRGALPVELPGRLPRESPGELSGAGASLHGWRRSVVKALFGGEAQATSAATWLSFQAWAHGMELQSIAELADRDWVQLTQAQFQPSEIAPGFWIVPSWHEPPARARHLIRLDPGQAFGTGTHPTTRMCLRWIARHADPQAPWSRVLDYGCGSGILAIAAALHGAGKVDAVDIDPVAVATTAANAHANSVALRAATPEAARGAYGLVLANILATPLTLLAPLLSGHVAPGGSLVLAGILERQATGLTDAYAPWLALYVSDIEDGWILMTARRPAAARVA
jgi:ribosomal protein L11 methyltransferase